MEVMKQLQPFFQVLQWAVVLAAAVFMLFMRSVFASKADHTALTGRVGALEVENQLLKQEVKGSPTAQQLHELELAMTTLTGKLEVHNERMEGFEELQKVMKRQVEVMDGYLRQGR